MTACSFSLSREMLRKCVHRIHPPNTIPMRTLRSIAFASYFIGILFKVLHWPGASIILLVSGVLTVVMLGLLLFRKPGPLTVQLQYPVLLIGSVMAVVTGGLFKIMHWPGANIMLLIGLLACAGWFLIPQRQADTGTA